ncbi:MAG TPA: hypothetical protein VIV60_32770, partial [Polyangiaceae bacterium]
MNDSGHWSLGEDWIDGPAKPDPVQWAERNHAISLCYQAQWGCGAELRLCNGVLLTRGRAGFPSAPCNVGMSLTNADGEAVLATAADYFATHKQGFSLYVRAERDEDVERQCRARGFVLCADLPVMLLEGGPSPVTASKVVELRLATTPDDVRTFARLAADSYATSDVPAPVVLDAFDATERILASSARLFLAYAKGFLVGCAMLLVEAEVAGVYWVA